MIFDRFPRIAFSNVLNDSRKDCQKCGAAAPKKSKMNDFNVLISTTIINHHHETHE